MPKSPYGFTIFLGNNNMNAQATTDVNALIGAANGGWIRPQVNPQRVFPSSDPATWNFAQYDDAIGQINAAGLNCWLSMGNQYPAWLLTGFSNGGTTLPGLADMQTIVTQLARRYNGSTTPNTYVPGAFLHIEAFDCNEVFDLSGNPTACRDWTQNGYPAIQASIYNIIKTYIPLAIVGTCAMLQRTITTLQANINAFYTGGGKLDIWNWHYHLANNTNTPWTNNVPGNAVFNVYWQTVRASAQANGDFTSMGAVTEAGIAINTNFGRPSSSVFTPTLQSQYMREEHINAMTSGYIKYIFPYSIDMTTDGMSLTQSGVAVVPTYNDIQALWNAYPVWPNSPSFSPFFLHA